MPAPAHPAWVGAASEADRAAWVSVALLELWHGPSCNPKMPYDAEPPEAEIEARVLALSHPHASRG